MTPSKAFESPLIYRLGPKDGRYFTAMLDVFSEAFDDPEHYSSARPTSDYQKALLARNDVVALVALAGDDVIGGLVAYELRKFEQERSEFYIYDLAVTRPWRRQSVATSLIKEVTEIAKNSGGWTVYVQADYGDDPAVALYTKLGSREDVMHFDIPVN